MSIRAFLEKWGHLKPYSRQITESQLQGNFKLLLTKMAENDVNILSYIAVHIALVLHSLNVFLFEQYVNAFLDILYLGLEPTLELGNYFLH